MASFDYATYAAAYSQQNGAGKSDNKVGFFKLADGGEALVRFNVSTLNDLAFASVHRVKKTSTEQWPSMTVSCLNPIGKFGECPLCKAVDNGDDRVQKVGKRVYVELLVSYKDPATGAWGPVTPVIWERPAGFYKELMSKINDYGDLKQQLFKIVRAGSGIETRYSINYAVPAVFKPEMIPADFSAFDGYDINRHAYWEKTAAECEEYLRTGSFPEVKRDAAGSQSASVAQSPKPAAAPTSEYIDYTAESTYIPEAPKAAVQQAAPTQQAPAQKPAEAVTNFGGFSF